MLRRSIGTFDFLSRVRSRPPTTILPSLGSSSFSSNRTSVDLPDPDAPTMKTNSPLSMWKVASSRATTSGSYTFVTPSNTIIVDALSGAVSAANRSTTAVAVEVRSGSCTCLSVASSSASLIRRCSAARLPGAARAKVSPSVAQSLRALPRSLREQVLANEAVEVAVEHALRVPDLETGAGVLHELVGVQGVGADRFAAEAGVGSAAAFLRQQRLAFLLGPLHEPCLQNAQRRLLVRRLRALVLALDDDARREVREPHGRVGLVDVLAACSLRAVRVDLEVALVDLDRRVVGEKWSDDHRREGGMPAVGRVERALAHEAVLPALGPEDPVRVLALDGEGRALQTRLLAWARLQQLDAEAAVRSPTLVHPQHHLGPVLCVGAAGAGLQRDDGVARVVLAVEERGFLQAVELAPERLDGGGDVVGHVAVHRR